MWDAGVPGARNYSQQSMDVPSFFLPDQIFERTSLMVYFSFILCYFCASCIIVQDKIHCTRGRKNELLQALVDNECKEAKKPTNFLFLSNFLIQLVKLYTI